MIATPLLISLITLSINSPPIFFVMCINLKIETGCLIVIWRCFKISPLSILSSIKCTVTPKVLELSYNAQKLGNRPAYLGRSEQCKLIQPNLGIERRCLLNTTGDEKETIKSMFRYLM